MKTEIIYKGIFLEVEGNYTEAKDGVMYYGDLDGHPGNPALFQTYDVFVEGVNIVDLLREDDLMEIDNLVLEKICG